MVILYGNLTRDPELKALPSGIQVASFGLATNRVFKDRDGNKQEQPEFHNVVVFGRQAETVAQYLKKGASAFIQGRIQTRTWEQEGQKKYKTEIIADRVQFGPKAGGGAGGSFDGGEAPRAKASAGGSAKGKKEENPAGIDYPADEINPDDIPF
mgnify:CR=1 FL=1